MNTFRGARGAVFTLWKTVHDRVERGERLEMDRKVRRVRSGLFAPGDADAEREDFIWTSPHGKT